MDVTYGELLKAGMETLRQAGIPDARRDSEWLLCAVAGITRSALFLYREKECRKEESELYFQLVDRRSKGEPAQYLIGSQEFMGLSFDVDPSVLIPRQDTETLVEQALTEAAKMSSSLQILDLCCGSGAIAISVAHELPGAEVMAGDFSKAALETAEHNALKNGVAEQIVFVRTDMFSVFRETTARGKQIGFDMILCNPPYIPTNVIPTLQREIVEYEPVNALDGGEDGLTFYRILAEEAWEFIKPGGLLLMEIGSDQAEAVIDLLNKSGQYSEPAVIPDLAGKDRVIQCRKR